MIVSEKRTLSKQKVPGFISVTSSAVSFSVGVALVFHCLESDNIIGLINLIGAGIWSSPMYFLFGISCLFGHRSERKILILSQIVFSILAFLFSLVLISVSSLSIVLSLSSINEEDESTRWMMINTGLLSLQIIIGTIQVMVSSVWWYFFFH